jgi:hypothetical protein
MPGFSFINLNSEQPLQLQDNRQPECVELSGATASNPARLQALPFSGSTRIHISRLLETSVPRTITEYEDKIIRGFINNFPEVIKFDSFTPASVTFDFGIERGFNSPPLRRAIINLLKRLAPYIIPSRFPVLLPIRLPHYTKVTGSEYRRFLLDLVISNIAYSIDIHPHEMINVKHPEELLRPIKFDIGLIKFIYEPAVGNHLTVKLLQPWFEYLHHIAYRGDIIFVPAAGNNELFSNEYRNLLKLWDTLQAILD